jgi:hypothetical protein
MTKTYSAPTVQVHGRVVELTASGSGQNAEGNGANCISSRKSNSGRSCTPR